MELFNAGKKSEVKDIRVFQNDYGPEFLNILKRIKELEDTSKELERKFELCLLSWESDISEAKRKLSKMKEHTDIIKKQIFVFKKNFMNIVYELKMCLNQDEFDKFKKKAENIKFENFITRNEFQQMVEESLD